MSVTATLPTTGKLALLGGAPVGKITPPAYPQFSERAVERVAALLRAGKVIGLSRLHSPEVAEAEAALSAYHGGRQVLATSSGHGALVSALAGLEICCGDEVITTPYTWGASISCILHQTAIPVFVDVRRDTGLIDPDQIEAAITPRTKAILAVHLYGQPADLKRLRAIADKRHLALIEDGSQAHGCESGGLRAGTVGDASGFSCMGGKVLATTEAGYMVTPHDRVYWKGAMAGQHMGRWGDPGFPDDLRPSVDSLIHTFRVTPINAVLLTEQLSLLDGRLAQRRQHADLLRRKLASARFVRFPVYGPGDKPSYHMVTMTFDPEAAGVTRDTFAAALKAEGMHAYGYVPSPVSDWPRLHWQDYTGPRAPWLATLERAGVDYRGMPLPNCRWRVANAIEAHFDFIEPGDEMINRMAEIILKVEAGIGALRDHERTAGPAAFARR
jgi:dTDP-4-amino-4,6-dideoxygalactose transaminase